MFGDHCLSDEDCEHSDETVIVRSEDTRHDYHDYECDPLNGEPFESAPEGAFECLLL